MNRGREAKHGFQPGRRWIIVMHGPNGANFTNESVFPEIQPDSRIVIEHVAKPWYKRIVTLTVRGGQTHLTWEQEHESLEVAVRMRPFCKIGNEQKLDRLQSLLASANDRRHRSPINAHRMWHRRFRRSEDVARKGNNWQFYGNARSLFQFAIDGNRAA
jgi:uncharacterized protein YndB with AHSA1/START domain